MDLSEFDPEAGDESDGEEEDDEEGEGVEEEDEEEGEGEDGENVEEEGQEVGELRARYPLRLCPDKWHGRCVRCTRAELTKMGFVKPLQ